jgi:hypothetical protein
MTVIQWAPVTPEAGLDQQHNPDSQLNLLLPWRTAYLEEPARMYQHQSARFFKRPR